MFLDSAALAQPSALAQPTTPADICAAIARDQRDFGTEKFATKPEYFEVLMRLRDAHRTQQRFIVASTKLTNAQKAAVRSALGIEKFEDRDSKSAKSAEKMVDSMLKAALEDPMHSLHGAVISYSLARAPLEAAISKSDKLLVSILKELPIYQFCLETKFLGEKTLARIIGETSGISRVTGKRYGMGDFRSVSAVWKRMGLAVIDGHRQGNPGKGATAQDWIDEGYNKKRRSVAYVGLQYMIGKMGNWRPQFGADVENDETLSEYQKLFARRARLEMVNAGIPIENKNGQESYKAHQTRRAMRVVEKHALKRIYVAYRACMG